MNTEDFLDDLADGKFLDEIGDWLRDNDKLQDYITGYAMDSYLGLHEHNPNNRESVIKQIEKMMHQVIREFEESRIC